MDVQQIVYRPIGIIRTPFSDVDQMPIQPAGGRGVEGTVEIDSRYISGLKDLEGFSHVMLFYHFHLSRDFSLRVKPYLEDTEHGVFSTHAPDRPNAIGLSVVELDGIREGTLYIKNLDIMDGTPLLDIKPFVPEINANSGYRIGWLSAKDNRQNAVKTGKRL